MLQTTGSTVKVWRTTLLLCIVMAPAVSAMAETMSVTAFGRGSTMGTAIEAARTQAVEDAVGIPLSDDGLSTNSPGTKFSGQVRSARILGVEKIGPNLYEAEIEAQIAVSAAKPLSRRTRVVVVPDPNRPNDPRNAELVEAVQQRLLRSSQFALVDPGDPSVARSLDRLRLPRAPGGSSPSVIAREPVPVDLICLISTHALQTELKASGVNNFEMKTRLLLIEAIAGEFRSVRTFKSTLSGASTGAFSAITVDTANQITRALSEYLMSEPVEDISVRHVISVPIAGVQLTVGQAVMIFKFGHLDELPLSTGVVIGVGPSLARVSSDQPLRHGSAYVVRPASVPKRHGIILDTDW